MKINYSRRISGFCVIFAFLAASCCWAQIVPFYPVEIFFNPVGYTNSTFMNKAEDYTTFSSLKVVLSKDLPAPPKMANTISLIGNLIQYHDITKARDYIPFSLNPVLRTHLFLNDLFTPSLELNGVIEYLPGTDSLARSGFKYTNYRLRVKPFFYLAMTPNIIHEQTATFGISKNSHKTLMMFKEKEGNKQVPRLVSRDYTILKYEIKFIYLTPFHTRAFLVPYCYYNSFSDVRARSKEGEAFYDNPKLKETGGGAALGLRYMTFTWGYTEGVVEFEYNHDLVYDANSYYKIKFSMKSENQYLTERFGYILALDWIKHISKNFAQGFSDQSGILGELGQIEFRADAMLILNLNRNVSIRPEFDYVFKNFASGTPNMNKYRYWLHLHILL